MIHESYKRAFVKTNKMYSRKLNKKGLKIHQLVRIWQYITPLAWELSKDLIEKIGSIIY